ncbi:MAG TPA: hypothetical protein ENK10_03725 [Acidobacteria bacterium]|nr:hypothetical protein [Acidobacteriota bacterium]
MLVKRFRARSCSLALVQVKQTLGEDAAILETRRTSDGVEVLAAAERPGAVKVLRTPASGAAPASGRVEWLVESLRSEGYSDFLAERIAAAAHANLDEQVLEDRHRVLGYARDLLALWLSRPQETTEAGPGLRIFVGPPGVGKTSTCAKLAARHLVDGQRVMLVSADDRRLGGAEQLEGYARVYGIPFRVARNADDLRDFRRQAGPDGVVIVDTPGVGRGDDGLLRHLVDLFAGVAREEIEVLLAADHDLWSLADTLRRFRPLAPGAVGATRTDQAVRRGPLVSALARARIPLAHLGCGPRIPDDLEHADLRRLAAWALPMPEERQEA